jgi:hypothetical protein
MIDEHGKTSVVQDRSGPIMKWVFLKRMDIVSSCDVFCLKARVSAAY